MRRTEPQTHTKQTKTRLSSESRHRQRQQAQLYLQPISCNVYTASLLNNRRGLKERSLGIEKKRKRVYKYNETLCAVRQYYGPYSEQHRYKKPTLQKYVKLPKLCQLPATGSQQYLEKKSSSSHDNIIIIVNMIVVD